jgi:branched-subunit amino acid aminotransferase/4-amino-4-deoxychorismate lyase
VNRRPTLIETVRVRDGVAPLWGHHLARLFDSCRAIGVPPPAELRTPEGGADRVHRLLVSARGVETGERPVGSAAPVRLVTATVRHEPYPHKTTSREPFDRAWAEAESRDADDGVMLVPGGWVAETAIWGVYWWEKGRLSAPPFDFGILDSVARRRLTEIVGGIAERRAAPAEVARHSAFVANAARGVVPVESIDGETVVSSSETAALAAAFWG